MAQTKKRGPGRPKGSKNKKTSTSSSRSNKSTSSAPKTKQEHIEELRAQMDKEKRTVDVIWSITLLAIGIFFLFTIILNSTGAFGKVIHDIGLGLFGIMAYVLPFLFILSSILLLFRKLQHINGRTVFFSVLMYICLCILNSYRFISDKNLAYGFEDIAKYYKMGVDGEKGGAVGMELGSLLVKGFGKPGLIIIALALLLISIFLVFNTPLAQFFSALSEKRETKRLLAEIEEAEKAKVQMAVASTATPGADPKTGILPQMGRYDAYTSEPPMETPRAREIYGGAASVEAPKVEAVEPVINEKPKKTGFFNTLFGIEPKNDEGKYDSENVGASGSQRKKTGYGLGDTSDIGHSGSYGLEGYDGESFDKAKRGTGLADETAKPAQRAKRVINRGVDPKPAASVPAADIPTTAAAVAVAAGAVKNAGNNDKADDNTDDVANEMSAALSASNDDSRYELPPVSLLKKGTSSKQMMTDYQLEERADLLEKTLKNFNVDATVLTVTQGASVTRYEVQPATGVKVSSITRLADDIALNLRAKSIRIEAPIPGKAAVGIEVENEKPAPVVVRDLIESQEFEDATSKIAFIVGKDISGNNIVADMASMPHLLIAGATGSGKSVCVNTIIASFLYKAKPSELKLIMIDPKMVELANYNGIPHMLVPVVTDPKKASRALAIAVKEMDDRYELFAKTGVKDLTSYNEHMRAEQEPQKCKPEIVIIIDELADLMMAAPSEVESSICRLAQKARAAGMHLIVATQRPSVDVVTGLIKANIPSRIAFSVSSSIDSRTILDMNGAEKLLGKGDMLFSPVGSNKPLRVQGPFISESETDKLVKFVKKQGGTPVYDEEIKSAIENVEAKGGAGMPEDELTEDAIAFIFKSKQASVSMLQRRFRIGYNRAARIIDEIEEKGIIGPSDGAKPRRLLVTEDEYYGGAEDVAQEDDALAVEEPAEEELTYEPYDGDSSGMAAFDSLPDEVKRQVMNSDD